MSNSTNNNSNLGQCAMCHFHISWNLYQILCVMFKGEFWHFDTRCQTYLLRTVYTISHMWVSLQKLLWHSNGVQPQQAQCSSYSHWLANMLMNCFIYLRTPCFYKLDMLKSINHMYIDLKVKGLGLNIIIIWTPIFEWYVVGLKGLA
jgi:hypothetical protein